MVYVLVTVLCVLAAGILVATLVALLGLGSRIEHVERHAGQRFDQMDKRFDELIDELRAAQIIHNATPPDDEDDQPARRRRHLRPLAAVIPISGAFLALLRRHPLRSIGLVGAVGAAGLVAALALAIGTDQPRSEQPQAQPPAATQSAPPPLVPSRRRRAPATPTYTPPAAGTPDGQDGTADATDNSAPGQAAGGQQSTSPTSRAPSGTPSVDPTATPPVGQDHLLCIDLRPLLDICLG